MTSPKFVFYLTCLILGEMAQVTDLKSSSSVNQQRGFISAKTGGTVTLPCFYESAIAARLYWYKQTLGEKPRIISTFYKYEIRPKFHDDFNNSRFTLDTENNKNHLTIADLQISDSATYYCASSESYKFEFMEGTLVSVQGSGLNVPAVVQQSISETIQPGGSVTLNCTVHTGSCDGEHRVYWFKHSEESHPGLIYTHGGRNQCERRPNTQTHTCVYNLPKEILDPSHDGTYYCAVVSCGHIVFGNSTKLNSEDQVNYLDLVYFLSGALTFTTVLVVLLVFLLCTMNKTNSCKCAETTARFSAPSTTTQGDQNEENILYAAVREHKVNRSTTGNSSEAECTYSSIKL